MKEYRIGPGRALGLKESEPLEEPAVLGTADLARRHELVEQLGRRELVRLGIALTDPTVLGRI